MQHPAAHLRAIRAHLPGRRLSLLARFSLVSLLLLTGIGVALAWSLQQQLENSALWQQAESASDQVRLVLRPMIQAADLRGPLDPALAGRIDAAVRQQILGGHIVRVKIWAPDGTVLYSDLADLVNRRFPVDADLQKALSGGTVADISTLDAAENVDERLDFDRLLEIYVPLEPADSTQVAGAFEIYNDLTSLQARTEGIQQLVWGGLGMGFLVLYAGLFTIVRGASSDLRRQNAENVRLLAEATQQLAERRAAEVALAHRAAFEAVIMGISGSFINLAPDEVAHGVDHALQRVGEFLDVDRVFVVLAQPGPPAQLLRAHEWRGPRLPEAEGPAAERAAENVARLLARLTAGESLRSDEAAAWPPEERAALATITWPGSQAVLLVPMIVGKELIGFLGCEIVAVAAGWRADTADLVRVVGEILASALARQRFEEALRASEERFRAIFAGAAMGVALVDSAGRLTEANPALLDLLGYPAAALHGQTFASLSPPEDAGLQQQLFAELIAGRRARYQMEQRCRRADGRWVWSRLTASLLPGADGRPPFAVAMVEDITGRIQAQEETARQLQRLAALRSIDMAITASVDLRVTLDVFLDKTLTQLEIDAAQVLLLNPHSRMLESTAGRGFRTSAWARTRYRLGQGAAGRAALDRRTVHLADLGAVRGVADSPLGREDFASYYAVPLIAKGQVKGVLEVFHRSPLDPDADWLDFLHALAGQAAIAVDNASLFTDLQRTLADLALAYDTTLEGWSRALDLRDKETQGHTQRVTEMTLVLARAVGVSEAEIVHVRRGALLHDIGKMGIPDAILLKPGPLTDEEWTIMRRHPTYAYELLAPIAYLRPALDIPYCHHEKWDGTGYPRGLQGEQIPPAARIFAVIDVWDALRSDRPYRAAWPEARVRAHIREQAGTHFDPRVVEAFLALEI